MKRLVPVLLLLAVTTLSLPSLQAQSHYRSYEEMTQAIKELASNHKDILKVESLGKTLKGRDIWAISLRKGDPGQNRAMLVVGGVEAAQIAGSEMALRFAEFIANSYGTVDSVSKLLESTTIYIIPRVSPDATEAFFETPKRERTTNYRPTDDDRDGLVDEDDVEDLNNDGVITMMRVKDPRGDWMPHQEDARVMKKADPAKGERGQYLLYTEGIDNDKDERWNEDGAGGVDFNRNFAYNYEYFAPNAGVYQLSEVESRAVADFVFSHDNICVVFSFSSNDNLMSPMKVELKTPASGEDRPRGFEGRGRDFEIPPVTNDQPYFDFVAKQFQDITKLKDAPEAKKGMGSFSEWVYYHTGRWSFSVRPWWAPGKKPTRDTTSTGPARGMRRPGAAQQAQDQQDDYSEQLRAISWYESNGYKDVFVPWTKFKHPDFPDRDVEIGGIRPFFLSNPPADSLASISAPYVKFLTYLAGQLPTLTFSNPKIERVGDGVYRLTLDIANVGYFPTNSSLGARVRWTRGVYLTLGLAKDQTLASGKAKQRLDIIKGNGGFTTMTWLIAAREGSAVTVKAESPTSGSITQSFTLR